MELFSQVMLIFWLTAAVGSVVTAGMLPWLRRMRLYKGADRKETLYGGRAVEYEKIRKKEEETIKKEPVLVSGGLLLLPTVCLIGIPLGLWLDSSAVLLSIGFIAAVFLVTLYDDLTDIGRIGFRTLRTRHRLVLIGVIAFVFGLLFFPQVPEAITVIPSLSPSLSSVLFALLFMLWCLFWQISSIIDGIDGMSGSVFLLLFSGNLILSVFQGTADVALLSALGIGVLVPWLFINYAPAKMYLSESGIGVLLMLFATVTFLSAGDGVGIDGLWSACIFGGVLIATWLSNVVQLLYRKKTGKKFFRIAPVHHHFEAIGIPPAAVVQRYMLVTFLLVTLGLTLLL